MPKFWVNPWLELNNIGFPSIITLFFDDQFIREGYLWPDNSPRNRDKLPHHIQLHEKWYPNSIKYKY